MRYSQPDATLNVKCWCTAFLKIVVHQNIIRDCFLSLPDTIGSLSVLRGNNDNCFVLPETLIGGIAIVLVIRAADKTIR